ncbi:MAG: transposase, partial [Planctomycetota bacterium]|nr:transposase [Planctomycetota bacterium]
HCPQCRGASRADWVDKTAPLLRAGTKYFQVVFTIPDKLSSLVLGNRRALYKLLFRSAASALQRSIAEECGMQAALTMVLHTWNQRLGHHPHVHALVPGSGPSLDGTRWVPCRYTQATRQKPATPFLVDNKELGRRFRDRYVRGVRRLIKAGVLQVEDSAELITILEDMQACDWVVYIQPPPKDTSDPADVLKYLARYMTGGPISDRRLIEVKGGRVYFWARSGDKSGRQVPVSLSTLEFVRSWTLHILPKGFTKARRYGGWSNTRQAAYQQQCDRLQPVSPSAAADLPEPPQPVLEPPPDEMKKCPHCQTEMVLESHTRRPSWRELFYGPEHPRWMEWRGSG